MWEKLTEELQDPWDWAAAGVGSAIGLVITIFAGGLDGGTSAATGAIVGATARKSAKAAFRKRQQKKRIQGLKSLIGQQVTEANTDGANILADRLDRSERLWDEKVIDDQQISDLIDELAQDYQNL